jgi:hypothetical protein
MSIWNKVLLWVIGLASLALFYMAARTLQTHRYWGDLATKFDRAIRQVQQENQRLAEGVPGGQPGIRQVRAELSDLLLDRRRAWFNCDPRVKLDRQGGTAEITLTVSKPDPNGIVEKTILYAFEEAGVQKGGRYLGEFKVTKTDEKRKQVTVVPNSLFSADELDRLGTSKGPWEIYQIMPRDNRDVLALLTDEQKKAMFPAETWQEYRKDGKPADKGDPKDRVVDGKYVRLLRDYQVLLSASRGQRTLLVDQIDASTRDKKLLDDALAQAKEQEAALQQELAAARAEAKKFAAERDAVKGYRELLERELKAVEASDSDLIKANKDMAGKMAQRQLEAARRIDERTRAMAQSGAGEQ